MNKLTNAAAIMGAKGGRSGTGESKARTREQCQRAASLRWGNIADAADRFWGYITKTTDDQCWEYSGRTSPDGYGAFRFQKRQIGAHRVAWMLVFGPIPNRMEICHHCDNPPCCNPKHLFCGTHKRNMEDASEKGRFKWRIGEHAGNAKLTEAKVLAIRSAFRPRIVTAEMLSKQYGVSKSAIHSVIYSKCWKHI